MFVAISKFAVANQKSNEVKQAFVQRPHLVDSAEGFVRMDVLTPRDHPNEFWLITYWRSEESFRKWHHSDAHHQSHKGIPKGLKLDSQRTELRFFEHISS